MMPVFIKCPRCNKNLVTEMPDGQVWEFEDGKIRCSECLVVLTIEHIHNELMWTDDPNPELN
jgi:transcription initiation factor TFIIIB Brf1 subunit/transcription initiation factor TFIIB